VGTRRTSARPPFSQLTAQISLAVCSPAAELGRQDRIDRGLEPGLSSGEKAELAVAKRRIAELETELHAMRRAMELVREVVPPKGGSRRSR
jgi:hypothetical protein